MRRDNQVRKDIVTYGITTINNVKESSQKTNSTISVNKKKQGYLSIYKYSIAFTFLKTSSLQRT